MLSVKAFRICLIILKIGCVLQENEDYIIDTLESIKKNLNLDYIWYNTVKWRNLMISKMSL